jgi:hypothetical protein
MFVVLDICTTTIAINNHKAIYIQVHVGNNTIRDVLLDVGSRVHTITKQLETMLGLPKPKPAPKNL